MRVVNSILAASLIAFGMTAAGPAAQAQTTTRDAAMARCIQAAQSTNPGTAEEVQAQRTAVYKACMTAAGFAP